VNLGEVGSDLAEEFEPLALEEPVCKLRKYFSLTAPCIKSSQVKESLQGVASEDGVPNRVKYTWNSSISSNFQHLDRVGTLIAEYILSNSFFKPPLV
jgi:hypothetical protein